MYQVDWIERIKAKRPITGRRAHVTVSRTVWYLGFTSLFTDISSEMVASTLPMYLVLHLGLSPLQFGFVDGLYQGMTALLRLVSGLIADRWRRYKEVAAAGYGLSAICKMGLLWAGSVWPMLVTVIAVDRVGKGLRSAPRDALLSLSMAQEHLGVAFGVHRTLDAGGAMLGPLGAFALLLLAPDAYDVLFIVSFCVALIGLGVLVLFVENHQAVTVSTDRLMVSLGLAIGLLREPRFRGIALAGGLLSLATISDNFIYLALQQRMQFSGSKFPLLSFFTALFYVVLAVPLGHLADRVGRSTVFLGGYGVLLLLYSVASVVGSNFAAFIGCTALLGAYYAATDGVLMAMASAVLPTDLRTSGLAVLTTVTSLMRLLSSVLLGWLWTTGGGFAALHWFLAGLMGAIVMASFWLRHRAEDV
jgi:MFS family permease